MPEPGQMGYLTWEHRGAQAGIELRRGNGRKPVR